MTKKRTPPPRTSPAGDAGPSTKSRATLDDESLAAWLRLVHTPGIGPVAGQLLLRRFGSPEAIFSATYRQLLYVLKQEKQARALLIEQDPQQEADIVRALAWLHACEDHYILTLDDPRYPAALLDLPDPPLLIYAHGSLEALEPDAVAIVGSRRASHDGLHNAHAFAQALARRGMVITSGLAEGIDAAAHVGALDGAAIGQPSTIAVTGAGIDRIYPAHHRMLATRILAQQGLIISEQPLGSAPSRGNFPRRNRMIAALSRGTLLVEAALRSGSLITARMAAELGRDVMAVPGSIHNPLSHGCHHLIRDGAALIETVDDILLALGMIPAPEKPGTLGAGRQRARQHVARRASGWREWQEIIGAAEASEDAENAGDAGDRAEGDLPMNEGLPEDAPLDDGQQLLAALGSTPLSAETLASRLDWPIARILITIQLLELGGQIGRHVDGRWQRT